LTCRKEVVLVVTVKAFRGIPVRGIFLAALRDELLFTQEELAPKIGMTKGSLSRLETSEMEGMNRESFRRLAELAGLSYEALRQRISVPPSPAQALQQIEATARQAGLTADTSRDFLDRRSGPSYVA
jgi:transcriptional regulator with XRE-family HTH domain